MSAWRYPCYCLPGPARCDDDTACARGARGEPLIRQRCGKTA